METVSIYEGENFGRRMMVRDAQQCDYTSCYWTGLLNIVKIVCFILSNFYHNKNQKIKILLKTLKRKKRGEWQRDNSIRWEKYTEPWRRGTIAKDDAEDSVCLEEMSLRLQRVGLAGAGHWRPCLSWNYKPTICCSKTLGPDVLLELEFSGF